MQHGDAEASHALFAALYDTLRSQARAVVRTRSRSGSRSSTLQSADVVNEVYLRIADCGGAPADRSHFFAVAAAAMRCVLVDHVRLRRRRKRAASGQRVELDDLVAEFEERSVDLLDLDAALARLATHSPRAARIVEMRFFGGLELSAIARALGVHERTVKRDWRYARAWLHAELT
jgi:RNA polymerase sigma factor (TIGR02999 family)